MNTKKYLKPDSALPEAQLEAILCSSDTTTGSIEIYEDLTEYKW